MSECVLGFIFMENKKYNYLLYLADLELNLGTIELNTKKSLKCFVFLFPSISSLNIFKLCLKNNILNYVNS